MDAKGRFLGKYVWIGIIAKGGTWVYTSSGIELEFENWAPRRPLSKPRHDAYDCVLSHYLDGLWYNEDCNHFHRFICEFV